MTDTLLVGSVPLMLVIFGLVEFFKSLGLHGRWLTVVSLLLGLCFGVAYRMASAGVPSAFADWFAVIIFGLAIGLTASGFYDFLNARLPVVKV